tara:strand:+ start:690 stop:2417 length:1728 start_codon:yes stop_codon:yes gene_type:complete
MASNPTTPKNSQALSLLQTLRSPKHALPAFGEVHDQQTGRFTKYDPEKITYELQNTVLDYVSNPPRLPSGETEFLTLLAYRQAGKSLSIEYAMYCKAAYIPGWDHICIADNRDRADYLHKRVHHLHQRWPEQIRSKTIAGRESRQLTFNGLQGGKMRILSAEAGAVGVGQSPDSFHASECHLWSDFNGSMFLINPSLINRREALVIFEATPWEQNCAWHEHYVMAKSGSGRHRAVFFPFWDGKLNVRPVTSDFIPTNDEIALLNRYQSEGLSAENLVFRRFIMDTDPEVRKNPEMFGVMYPFDDLTCWIAATNAAIPNRALQKHLKQSLKEWVGPYAEYEPPEMGAIYAIGVDPCGYAARDHASFQVLKCWDGEWTQVAVYAEHIDPLSFTNQLIRTAKRYGNARICVESNGVGQAVIALLNEREYSNLYYEARFKAGFTSTAKSLDKATGWLIEGLLDELIFNDRESVEQLQTYKNDKSVEEGASSEVLRGTASKKRRDRHHWDKVSALIMAVVCARDLPVRTKPGTEKKEKDSNVVLFSGMSYEEQEKYRESLKADMSPTRKRPAYRSIRRRK